MDNNNKHATSTRSLIRMIVMLGLGAIGIAFIIVAFAIGETHPEIVWVMWLIGAIFLVGAFIAYCVFRNFENSHCGKCGKSLYGAAYSYELINVRHKENDDRNEYIYQIEATCPHCGQFTIKK